MLAACATARSRRVMISGAGTWPVARRTSSARRTHHVRTSARAHVALGRSHVSQFTMVIAIDGPSGAGKGTVARAVAARLGYRHIDTGAMYRAVAWKALCEGLDLADEDAIADLAGRARIEVGDGVVRIDGHDVAQAIRTPQIDARAAAVARQPRVRQHLVAAQRPLGA